METHVRIAGWLRIVGSALGLLLALVVGLSLPRMVEQVAFELMPLMGQGVEWSDVQAALESSRPLVVRLGLLLGVVGVLVGVAGIVVGRGLLIFRPWARRLNVAISILDLFNLPLGTALGVYSIWVMLHPATVTLFESGPSRDRYPAHFRSD